MSLVESLKRFFKDKDNGDKTTVAPEGVCPNCWGRQEWEGEFYKQIKAKNITPESNTYNSFINEVASKLDEIKLKEDTYECTTCNVKYKHDNQTNWISQEQGIFKVALSFGGTAKC